ncbi:MAG: hypothetical protein HYT70_02485 [Candidatus Aenigmarchaeota archaeon]|nr:hypothetical protein [Candidatus Aenigmarchaeota archaeon]
MASLQHILPGFERYFRNLVYATDGGKIVSPPLYSSDIKSGGGTYVQRGRGPVLIGENAGVICIGSPEATRAFVERIIAHPDTVEYEPGKFYNRYVW